MLPIIIKIKKTNGKLYPFLPSSIKELKRFTNILTEGQTAHVYFEPVNDNGTLLQLAKVHAMIRQLALHTGTTFQGMKLEIKRRAGLFLIVYIDTEPVSHIKSFGEDCSVEDLSLAIHACIEIGEEVNYILN